MGTTQLVLLGRWLQARGYAFWSLGHCYSPSMDYKRRLGHRVLPRADFLRKLRRHRGPFVAVAAAGRHRDRHGQKEHRPLVDRDEFAVAVDEL